MVDAAADEDDGKDESWEVSPKKKKKAKTRTTPVKKQSARRSREESDGRESTLAGVDPVE